MNDFEYLEYLHAYIFGLASAWYHNGNTLPNSENLYFPYMSSFLFIIFFFSECCYSLPRPK